MNSIISVLLLILSIWSGSSTQKSYIISGPSMSPTINEGDTVIVNTDKSQGIFRDDIILFETEEKPYVKRVIGVTGDRIEISKNGIIVNGKLMYKTLVTALKNPQLHSEKMSTMSLAITLIIVMIAGCMDQLRKFK